MRLKDGLRFVPVLVLLAAGVVCPGQSTAAPQFNTAGAGVKTSDVESAVSVICKAGDITRSKEGKVTGCRTCPAGTDFHTDRQSHWEMYAETPGHFISTQDDNLILDGTGCDSHAMNFGGSFVFALNAGKARLIRYDQGLVTSQCHKFAYTDGRDFLVCRGGWGGQGENNENVFMASFGISGKETISYLISTSDTTATCEDDSTQVVQESEIKAVKFAPLDSGKVTGMTVTATLGSVKCSQTGQKSAKPAGTVKTYEIEFLFDGGHFKVTPASRIALRQFENN
jgi:hypothetical protein